MCRDISSRSVFHWRLRRSCRGCRNGHSGATGDAGRRTGWRTCSTAVWTGAALRRAGRPARRTPPPASVQVLRRHDAAPEPAPAKAGDDPRHEWPAGQQPLDPIVPWTMSARPSWWWRKVANRPFPGVEVRCSPPGACPARSTPTAAAAGSTRPGPAARPVRAPGLRQPDGRDACGQFEAGLTSDLLQRSPKSAQQ